MKSVRNFPKGCDPRTPCWASCWNSALYPMPYRWAVQILSPVPAPDSLPTYFYIEPSIILDPINGLDYWRELSVGAYTWDFRLQFDWYSGAPAKCEGQTPYRVRFQWTNVDQTWTGIRDLDNELADRPDLYEPSFSFDNLGVPPWPSGEWIEQVRVGGLVYDGTDSDAENRAGFFA